MQKVIYTNVRLSNDATCKNVNDQFYEIRFTIAATRDNSTNTEKEVDWIPVRTLSKSDKQVEYFSKHLLKGAMVEFTGRLFIEPYSIEGIKRKDVYVKVPIQELSVIKLPSSAVEKITSM